MFQEFYPINLGPECIDTNVANDSDNQEFFAVNSNTETIQVDSTEASSTGSGLPLWLKRNAKGVFIVLSELIREIEFELPPPQQLEDSGEDNGDLSKRIIYVPRNLLEKAIQGHLKFIHNDIKTAVFYPHFSKHIMNICQTIAQFLDDNFPKDEKIDTWNRSLILSLILSMHPQLDEKYEEFAVRKLQYPNSKKNTINIDSHPTLLVSFFGKFLF